MNYLLRSMLFVPAYKEKFLEKAALCDADAIIFDLEDSVPEGKRRQARQVLGGYLKKGIFDGRQLFIRVNKLGGEDLLEDLKLIEGERIAGIVVPKICGAEDIREFAKLLEACERREGLKDGSLKLLPLIENAQAVMNVQEIAGCSKRIIALLFGGEDYLDSVWGKHTDPPRAFDVPRAMIVMAARMYGILPIDTPYLDLKNREGFMEEEGKACCLGFAGALLVNPVQIPWANECFQPSCEEMRQAQKVLDAVEGMRAAGESVAMLEGRMIGPPMIKRARKVLELKRKLEEKEAKNYGDR